MVSSAGSPAPGTTCPSSPAAGAVERSRYMTEVTPVKTLGKIALLSTTMVIATAVSWSIGIRDVRAAVPAQLDQNLPPTSGSTMAAAHWVDSGEPTVAFWRPSGTFSCNGDNTG